MRRAPSGRLCTAVAVGWLLVGFASAAEAQNAEVAPFFGYRFGGDLFEEITATTLDVDGAPTFGATADIFVGNGQSVMFIYSRQQARVDVPTISGAVVRDSLSVDHWHIGGAQHLGNGPVRPIYGASLGLTRFAGPDGSEFRFSVGVGGGVKLMATRHLGARLEGRGFLVFVDGKTRTACVDAGCITRLAVSTAWQVEFTAGMTVAF